MTESGGLALVLSGGGAPAAYFGAGVIAAVERAGLSPRVLSGVSAGAINACALGVGMDAAGLAALWRDVRWRDIYRPRTDLRTLLNLDNVLAPSRNVADYLLHAVGWTSLLDVRPAAATLARALGGEQLPIREDRVVVVSSVDAGRGELVRFCSELPSRAGREPLYRRVPLAVHHVLASTAVPLLFPPVADGNATYVDAGLVANTPLAPAMDYEPDAVIVVSGGGIARPARPPTSLGEVIGLVWDNVAQFALHADFDHAETVNTLVRSAPDATDKRHVPMLLVEPTDLGFSASGFLRFSAESAEHVMAHGRAVGERALAGWSPAL